MLEEEKNKKKIFHSEKARLAHQFIIISHHWKIDIRSAAAYKDCESRKSLAEKKERREKLWFRRHENEVTKWRKANARREK